jgi:hypothetical protein
MSTQELTIAITCRVEGYETEITFSGDIDQLKRIATKLAALGIEPTAPHTAPLNGENKPSKRVQPAYDGDGQPICPVHGKPLSEGRYGLFCPSKAKGDEAANDKGYCSLKFAE